MRKLRLREGKSLAQGRTADQWHGEQQQKVESSHPPKLRAEFTGQPGPESGVVDFRFQASPPWLLWTGLCCGAAREPRVLVVFCF